MSITKEGVFAAIDLARENLSKKRGYEISANLPVCGFICEDVVMQLGNHGDIDDIVFHLTDTIHHVLRLTDNGERTLFDPQYKQFVPAKLREKIPDNLVINSDNIDAISIVLSKLGVTEELTDCYKRALE